MSGSARSEQADSGRRSAPPFVFTDPFGPQTKSLTGFVRELKAVGNAASGGFGYRLERASPQRLFERVLKGLEEQQKLISALAPNWDGYGADPISPTTLDLIMLDLKTALENVDCPPPDLVPGGDGSLQAEWHRRSIEVTYCRDAEGNRHAWVRRRMSGREQDAYQLEALALLKESAPDLAY